MCEFCGLSGKCGVCGWDQGSVGERAVRLVDDIVMQVVGGVGDGDKRLTGQAALNAELEARLACGDACDDSGLDLAALDGSLAMDAREAAAGAVLEFAERIGTDVRYAVKQLQKLLGCGSLATMRDCGSRALDALERVEGVIGSVVPG